MGDISKFQLILLAVFGFFIVIGVLFFALFQGGSTTKEITVVLWGVYPKEQMDNFLSGQNFSQQSIKFNYVEKDPATLDTEFTEALAEGRGPDLLMMPQSLLLKEKSKLLSIGFNSYSERSFRDTFIDGADVLIDADGIAALPFTVDPLLMYWNRTMFSNASLSQPPKEWSEFLAVAPKLTQYDKGNAVRSSAVALGSFDNISNAKEIITTLLMQSGVPIVTLDSSMMPITSFTTAKDSSTKTAEATLSFYTVFANASKNTYTWNPALPLSRDLFAQGQLAAYFGFGSELPTIRRKNPNLDFDVAPVPQTTGMNKVTYGNFIVLAIPRAAINPANSFAAATVLTSNASLADFAKTSKLPPVRRDLLAVIPGEAYPATLYRSALIARAWRDPYPEKTRDLFKSMVTSVTSGNTDASGALQNASTELSALIRESNEKNYPQQQ